MRFVKRENSRFQSNHQRGYFCRKSSMSTVARTIVPPAVVTSNQCRPAWTLMCSSVAMRITIGITVMNRNPVVSRLSGRSG